MAQEHIQSMHGIHIFDTTAEKPPAPPHPTPPTKDFLVVTHLKTLSSRFYLEIRIVLLPLNTYRFFSFVLLGHDVGTTS